MNLQSKQDFAAKCFEIFTAGDDLAVIVDQIEVVMTEYGLVYTGQNITTTLAKPNGQIEVLTARDLFIEALDTDITNPQQMKVILSDHINFLHAFISQSKAA